MTLDGGPISQTPIALVLEVFTPLEACDSEDKLYWTTVAEMCKRLHKRPGPLCTTCDYEFKLGEIPPLLYCTRPFIPKSNDYTFISGAICPHCAEMSGKELLNAIGRALQKINPDLKQVVDPGAMNSQ